MIVSKRHKRHPYRIHIANRIEDIPPDDWHSVYPETMEGYNFLNTLDKSGLKEFTFYYIMVYNNKRPVAAAPGFLMEYSLDTSINGPLRQVSNRIKKIAPNIFGVKTLVCGMPLGPGRIGITENRNDVLKAILRKMEHIAKKKNASIVAFKDFDSSYADMLGPLQKEGFTKFDSLPNTELNICFKDFDGYLQTLSAASRYDFRRKFKKLPKDLNITLEAVGAIDGKTLEDVYRLYMNVVKKHEMGFEILPIGFFKHISDNLQKHAKFFLWRIDGELAAFNLCLVSEDVFMVYYIGLDYAIAHKYHLYFLTFRDLVNWCIENKIKKFEMGYKGYDTKRRLGFDLIPLYIYAKLRNRMLRPVFNLFCQLLKFENFDASLKKA
jgi:predicted N-acyltransferase